MVWGQQGARRGIGSVSAIAILRQLTAHSIQNGGLAMAPCLTHLMQVRVKKQEPYGADNHNRSTNECGRAEFIRQLPGFRLGKATSTDATIAIGPNHYPATENTLSKQVQARIVHAGSGGV